MTHETTGTSPAGSASPDSGEPTRPRSVEIEVEVDVPLDAAWRAVSEDQEIRRWFAPEARIEPGEGGSIWLSWGQGVEGEAPIDAWEPGRRLRWIEEYPDPDVEGGTVRLATEFVVEGREGSTVIRLVHSGFPDSDSWDDYFDGVLTGWSYFMRHLELYLERHRGEERQMIHDRRPPGVPTEDAWRQIMGPDGLDIPEALEALEGGVSGATEQDAPVGGEASGPPAAGAPFTIRGLGDQEHRGRIWMCEPGGAFAGVVSTLGDAPLFVEFEFGGERWKCGTWLSTYGMDQSDVERLQERLTEVCSRAFGAADD